MPSKVSSILTKLSKNIHTLNRGFGGGFEMGAEMVGNPPILSYKERICYTLEK
jgi:hypothetical protein